MQLRLFSNLNKEKLSNQQNKVRGQKVVNEDHIKSIILRMSEEKIKKELKLRKENQKPKLEIVFFLNWIHFHYFLLHYFSSH